MMSQNIRAASEVISEINLNYERHKNVSDALLILGLSRHVPRLGEDLDSAWKSGRSPIPDANRISSIRDRIMNDPLSYYDGSSGDVISELASIKQIRRDSPAFDLALLYLQSPTKLQVAKAGMEAKLDANFKELECIKKS